jgi:hypothetical protein
MKTVSHGNRKENTRVEVFWFVILRSVVVGYRRFGGPCSLHIYPADKICAESVANLHVLLKERNKRGPKERKKTRNVCLFVLYDLLTCDLDHKHMDI